jgi:hypothetical protein
MRLLKLTPLTLLFIAGCKPTGTYVRSANDVRQTKATLYFLDKDSIPGTLTVDLENNFHTNAVYRPIVQLIPEGKTEKQEYNLNTLSGYRIGADYYELKLVDKDLNNVHRELFIRRLTPPGSKIHLYHLHSTGLGNQIGDAQDTYYLSLPGFGPLETINSHSARLLPFFELKMSAIVADCPSLANKIRAKEPAYYIPFTSFKASKHPDVLLKIISEYNQCR